MKIKLVIISLMIFLILLTSIPCIVYSSTENWVEVERFEGRGLLTGKSESFEVNHFEWRIKYNYTFPFEFGNIPLVFYLASNESYIVLQETQLLMLFFRICNLQIKI